MIKHECPHCKISSRVDTIPKIATRFRTIISNIDEPVPIIGEWLIVDNHIEEIAQTIENMRKNGKNITIEFK